MGQYDETMQSLEPRSRGGKGPVLAILAVVAALCVVGGILVTQMRGDAPKQVVITAVKGTFERAEQHAESLSKTYPAIAASKTFASREPARMDYDLSFAGIEGIDYAQIASVFLSGSGLQISAAQDPGSHSMDLTMAVNFLGQSLLEGRYFLSPDLLAVSVPTFSDAFVSVRPQSFAADYPASPLGRLYPSSRQALAMVQQQLDSMTAQLQATDPQHLQSLKSELQKVGAKLLSSTEFSKLEDGRYRVTAPGDAVQAAMADAIRLWVNATYSDAMLDATASGSGMTMRQQLEQLDGEIPPLDISADLTIDKQVVTAAEITFTAPARDGAQPETALLTYTRDAQLGHIFELTAIGETMNGLSVRSHYSNSEEGQRYLENLAVAIETDSEPSMLSLDWHFSTGTDGTLQHVGSLSLNGESTTLGFTAEGALTSQGDLLKMSLPKMSVSFLAPYQPRDITLLFDLDLTYSPLQEGLRAPDTSDLFSMSNEEIMALSRDYKNGMQELERRFSSLFLP